MWIYLNKAVMEVKPMNSERKTSIGLYTLFYDLPDNILSYGTSLAIEALVPWASTITHVESMVSTMIRKIRKQLWIWTILIVIVVIDW